MTGSMLFVGMLVIGLLDITVSGENTVKAAEAANVTQATYTTPEQAGQALRAAVSDENKLAQVLGPDSTAIVFSGDAAEDKAALAEFAAKYDRMNRWVTMTDGSRILYIGADNYPYPIPLALNSSSQWYFNISAGKDEILARRIGKNELLAIDAVSAMAIAEQMYFKSGHNGNPPHRYCRQDSQQPWQTRRAVLGGTGRSAVEPARPAERVRKECRDLDRARSCSYIRWLFVPHHHRRQEWIHDRGYSGDVWRLWDHDHCPQQRRPDLPEGPGPGLSLNCKL